MNIDLQNQAKNGDAMSQYQLALDYYYGNDIEQDLDLAFYWAKKSASQNLAEAQYILGALYMNGEGTSVNKEEAIKLFKLSAAQGNTFAKDILEKLCPKKEEAEENPTKEESTQEQTPSQLTENIQVKPKRKLIPIGLSILVFLIACLAYTKIEEVKQAEQAKQAKEAAKEKERKRLEQIERAALAEHRERAAQAKRAAQEKQKEQAKRAAQKKQIEQAEAYYNAGLNQLRVYDREYEAVMYFYEAAKLGHTESIYQIGIIHYRHKGLGSAESRPGGNKVAQDYSVAVKYFKLAAGQGHINAEFYLACCYKNATGIEQNMTQAAKLFKRPAENGNDYAQYHLGSCYYYGDGVEQDYEEATKWLEKASKQGLKYAKELLESPKPTESKYCN